MNTPAQLPAGKTCGDCEHHTEERCYQQNPDLNAEATECNYIVNGLPMWCFWDGGMMVNAGFRMRRKP